MRALHIVEPHSPSQGQPLHRSIGNRAAKPGVLQQLRAHETLPALQADVVPLHGFHGQEGALLHFGVVSISCRFGQTLMVCGAFVGTAPRGTTRASAGASRRFSRSLICTRLTSGPPTPPASGSVAGPPALLRPAGPAPAHRPAAKPLVEAPALRELVAPAARQIVQQLAVLQLLADLRTREAIQHSGQLPKVPEQQEANLLVHTETSYISPRLSPQAPRSARPHGFW